MADLEQLAVKRDRGYLLRLVLMLLFGIGASAVVWQALTGDRVSRLRREHVPGPGHAARTQRQHAGGPGALRRGGPVPRGVLCAVGRRRCAPRTRVASGRGMPRIISRKGERHSRLEATEATYDVLIVGFDQRDEPPVARLARAFGIAPETAAQIVGKLPAAVQRGVPRVRADYFARALVMIGASVELRDKQGELIAAHAPESDAGSAEPIVQVVRPSEPAARLQASAAPPPSTFDPSPARNPWIDPMSRTIAAGPPVMNAHEAPRAAQQTPHQAFAAVAAAAVDPGAAHVTVREMNAVAAGDRGGTRTVRGADVHLCAAWRRAGHARDCARLHGGRSNVVHRCAAHGCGACADRARQRVPATPAL